MAMITISQCLDFTSLAPNEIILGASLGPRHQRLLSSYLLNLDRGATAVRDMIIADLRSFLDVGARQRAADQLLVLRIFLAEYPQALCDIFGHERAGASFFSDAGHHDDWRDIAAALNARAIPIGDAKGTKTDAVILPFCRG